VVGAGPAELRQIARDLNAILDSGVGDPTARGHAPAQRDSAELRRLIAWALDQHPTPTLVLDADGHTVAMNRAMQERQDADDASPAVNAEGSVTDGWAMTELDGTALRIVQPAPGSAWV
jgi:PAS domain-containing protein